MKCRAFLRLWFALLAVSVAAAETKSFRPVADTTLFESSPNDNMGGWTHAAAGTTGSQADNTRNRALLRFDLTSIPAAATVTSVRLVLQVTGAPISGRRDSNFELRRVLVGWGEGTKLGDRGALAEAGESTWNSRFHLQTAWQSPGGLGDVAASSSAFRFITGLGEYWFGSTTNLVSDVQLWITNSAANHGWMLLSQAESLSKTARRFGSREDEGAAPELVVDYEISPDPPFIYQIELSEKDAAITFGAVPGASYTLEESLDFGTWFPRAETVAGGTNSTLTAPRGELRGFFRVSTKGKGDPPLTGSPLFPNIAR